MELVLRAKEMMNCLPPYWHENEEMQRIFYAESVELDTLHENSMVILNDAFIMTMGESRIYEWEKWLKLPHGGTLEERRLRILQYFAVIAKLNEGAIKALVAMLLDDARAFVKFIDSTIKILVLPLPENFMQELDFTQLNQQLNARKPCHISIDVARQFSTWGDIKDNFTSWANLKSYRTWEEILMYIPE